MDNYLSDRFEYALFLSIFDLIKSPIKQTKRSIKVIKKSLNIIREDLKRRNFERSDISAVLERLDALKAKQKELRRLNKIHKEIFLKNEDLYLRNKSPRSKGHSDLYPRFYLSSLTRIK